MPEFTYDQIRDALVDEGLKVVAVPGSRQRCRCHDGSHAAGGPKVRAWAPTGDVMTHITGGDRGQRTALQYIDDIINGDPQLASKSQFVTDYDGTVYLNSVGRCNHAGDVGSKAVAASLEQRLSLEEYEGDLRGADRDGNAIWWGNEVIAASKMTVAQRESAVRVSAAIARLSGRNGRGSIGHGEASSARAYADPGINTGLFRRDVVARVNDTPTKENQMTSKQTTAATVDHVLDATKEKGKPWSLPKQTFGQRVTVGVVATYRVLVGMREIRAEQRAERKETRATLSRIEKKLDQLLPKGTK